MTKTNLNVDEKKTEILALLEKAKNMVLATCADNRVTARAMSFVHIDLNIFMATDQNFIKVQQIIKNPKVALCLDSLQIEGEAEIMGNPFQPQNAEFCELFKQKHPHSYDLYMAGKNQIVIKMTPALFTQWKYVDGKPLREFWDVKAGSAYREYFEVIQ